MSGFELDGSGRIQSFDLQLNPCAAKILDLHITIFIDKLFDHTSSVSLVYAGRNQSPASVLGCLKSSRCRSPVWVVFGFFNWTGGDLAVDADLLKKSVLRSGAGRHPEGVGAQGRARKWFAKAEEILAIFPAQGEIQIFGFFQYTRWRWGLKRRAWRGIAADDQIAGIKKP
ncbi:hypothetical protein [Pseudomonas helmanticensis]|uniref:hypothetical protein n=1 Tax=Pseudomonas helmanticensis TaxID=1471381 RepID=UPI0024B6B2F1|nr:hypothetical protein [Pseudomonas helmanticensis]